MRVRLGFVSNSSSSSYICECCGEIFCDWDSGMADFDIVECENGHCCCEIHLNVGFGDEKAVQTFLQHFPDHIGEDRSDILSEMRYNFPSQFCPLCCLEVISTHDLADYYELRFGLDKDEVLEDIKSTFGTYEAFRNACNGNR